MTTRPSNPANRPLDDESGSVSVELTLLAGLLAVLALGLVQLAFLGYAREAAGYAAHDTLDEATAYGGNLAAARDLAPPGPHTVSPPKPEASIVSNPQTSTPSPIPQTTNTTRTPAAAQRSMNRSRLYERTRGRLRRHRWDPSVVVRQ